KPLGRGSGVGASLTRSFLCMVGLCFTLSQPVCQAFNLDVEQPLVYSGPEGSHFGYAVDFYLSEATSLVIGAPKANTTQSNVTEGGSVFYCPWSLNQTNCHPIEFDSNGDRMVLLNDTEHQADFKSHQWFGATVRSHGDTILACAPLYSWRTQQDNPRSDATGTCYLSVHNFSKFVEYAPCRNELSEPEGQGYCQGGFSADFTQFYVVFSGQVISAHKEDIIKAYYPGYFMQAVDGQLQTKQMEMGSYFGYAVATTDLNSDGMVDLLVGAPMLMVRDSDGRLEEMGRVYVYLQRGPMDLETPALKDFVEGLLSKWSCVSVVDVAISGPFGGEDHQGLVYIYNGFLDGLREKPSQVIKGQWATGTLPACFGFALRGASDLDLNGYPDLIVGAFGVDKAVLYRSRPIVNATASLTVYPTMINPDEKNCFITNGNASVPVSCHKQKQKGGERRALFFDSQQPSLQRNVRVRHGERVCNHTKIYLREEKDFRDKLSPIYVSLNFSLDPQAAADAHGLRPVLNYQTTNLIEQKTQILLDCGEDNICVPDLKLLVQGDRKEVFLGDDNSLTLTFNARNEGGGAYEAELYVVLPPEADYSGIARNNESLTQLTCSYDTENQTRYLSCDLGNPMKSGTNLWAGLRFKVPRLKDTHKTIQFEFQIRRVSRPDKVFFPPANWRPTKSYAVEQEVGPAVEHIYELLNNGPSQISSTLLELRCPLSVQGQQILYPLDFSTKGPINCTADKHMNHRHLKVKQSTNTNCDHTLITCNNIILNSVVTPLLWNKPETENWVPLWIIILAILAGLLLLALLIYVLYRLGFFKRSLPYGTAMEKAQLKPQAASEA
uniref:Integrin alpha-5-like n=1 Tax=Gouania willdenowi TaxID=441366 RepID=A0A8C5N9J3_GOUWI